MLPMLTNPGLLPPAAGVSVQITAPSTSYTAITHRIAVFKGSKTRAKEGDLQLYSSITGISQQPQGGLERGCGRHSSRSKFLHGHSGMESEWLSRCVHTCDQSLGLGLGRSDRLSRGCDHPGLEWVETSFTSLQGTEGMGKGRFFIQRRGFAKKTSNCPQRPDSPLRLDASAGHGHGPCSGWDMEPLRSRGGEGGGPPPTRAGISAAAPAPHRGA